MESKVLTYLSTPPKKNSEEDKSSFFSPPKIPLKVLKVGRDVLNSNCIEKYLKTTSAGKKGHKEGTFFTSSSSNIFSYLSISLQLLALLKSKPTSPQELPYLATNSFLIGLFSPLSLQSIFPLQPNNSLK